MSEADQRLFRVRSEAEPIGAVLPSSVEDLEKLARLYCSVLPGATSQDFQATLVGHGAGWWKVYKDSSGEIRAAIMVKIDGEGAVMPFIDPKEADSPRAREALTLLIHDIGAIFAKIDLVKPNLVFPASLRKLGDYLEETGHVGKVIFHIRSMHFLPSGRVQ
jgi:hypothetical protein